jgi:hypothetical protein
MEDTSLLSSLLTCTGLRTENL